MNGLPLARSAASGPTKGTDAGSDCARGVRTGFVMGLDKPGIEIIAIVNI